MISHFIQFLAFFEFLESVPTYGNECLFSLISSANMAENK